MAGAEIIPGDVVTGKAAEEQRRQEKGKAKVQEIVIDIEADRMSMDSAFTAEQQGAGRKVQLRKLASMVLGGGPTLVEAMEAAIPTERSQQAASGGMSHHDNAASLHARHPSSSSTSSRADVELAVWDSAGPSRWGSSASDLSLARGDSSSKIGGPGCSSSFAGSGGAEAGRASSSSSSSAGAWGTMGHGCSSMRYA